MKKLIALFLTMVMIFAFSACGESAEPTETEKPSISDSQGTAEPTETEESAASASQETAEPTETEDIVPEQGVAMITDYGDVNDQSYNQATWEAVRKFCAGNNMAAAYYRPATNDTAGRVAAIERAVTEGHDVLVLPGYVFSGAIAEVSSKYPEVKFIGLDVSKGDLLEGGVFLKGESYDYNPDNWNLADYVYMDNVCCATYREEVAGFMAGYATVKLGYTRLGFMGGMSVPAVMRYGYGYVQGADAAAKELGMDVEMNYIYNNGFCSGEVVTSAMEQWYNSGTEVIFACGNVEMYVSQAAENAGGKMIVSEQFWNSNISRELLVTAALRDYGATVRYVLTEALVKDNWASVAGKTEKLGLVSGVELSLNHVMLPEGTVYAGGKFTAEDYGELVKRLVSGELMVSDNIAAEPVTTNVTVNYLGNLK